MSLATCPSILKLTTLAIAGVEPIQAQHGAPNIRCQEGMDEDQVLKRAAG